MIRLWSNHPSKRPTGSSASCSPPWPRRRPHARRRPVPLRRAHRCRPLLGSPSSGTSRLADARDVADLPPDLKSARPSPATPAQCAARAAARRVEGRSRRARSGPRTWSRGLDAADRPAQLDRHDQPRPPRPAHVEARTLRPRHRLAGRARLPSGIGSRTTFPGASSGLPCGHGERGRSPLRGVHRVQQATGSGCRPSRASTASASSTPRPRNRSSSPSRTGKMKVPTRTGRLSTVPAACGEVIRREEKLAYVKFAGGGKAYVRILGQRVAARRPHRARRGRTTGRRLTLHAHTTTGLAARPGTGATRRGPDRAYARGAAISYPFEDRRPPFPDLRHRAIRTRSPPARGCTA